MRARVTVLAALVFAAPASAAPPTSAYYAMKATVAVERSDKFLDEGKLDEGIRQLDAAIRLDPNNATAFRYRGYAWLQKQDFVRAIRDYDRAIELDPKTANLHIWKSRAWDGLGDRRRAMQAVD
jgi:tetratricopeptide (TPR) repeat protein